MATEIDFIFPAAVPAIPVAEEESSQASWAETAVTVIAVVITVLIVATISVLMAMASHIDSYFEQAHRNEGNRRLAMAIQNYKVVIMSRRGRVCLSN